MKLWKFQSYFWISYIFHGIGIGVCNYFHFHSIFNDSKIPNVELGNYYDDILT